MRSMNFDGSLSTPSRGRGAVAAGLLLTGIMGGLTAAFAWILLAPNASHGVAFNGDSATAAGIMAIFVFLLIFGISATWAGFRQMHTGRRDFRVVRFGLIVAAALMAFGILARIANR